MSRRRALSTLVVVLAASMMVAAPVSAAIGAGAGTPAIDSSDTAPTPALDTSGHSIQISSDSGVDGAMNQSVAVETNTTYTLSGWIKTENVQAGSGYGAQLNVHELEQSSLTESVTGTQGWTHVETTINSGSNEELQINTLLGGWGDSTGTAYYDDIRFENPQGENLLSNGDLETGSLDPWQSQTWTGSGDYGISDQESVATGDVSTRTVGSDTVAPGEQTTVTVDVETNGAESFTVVENFDPAFENVELVDTDGAAVSAVRNADDAVFAAYNNRSEATLTYRVTLGNASTVQEGDHYRLSGFAQSEGERSATGGQDQITVGAEDIGSPGVQSERTVDTENLDADGTATVSVSATPSEASSFIIYEDFNPAFESVEIVDADGADVTGVRDNESLFASYNGSESVTLVYEVEVGEAGTYSFDGNTSTDTPKGAVERPTLGTDSLTFNGSGTAPEANGTVQFTQEDYVFAPGETRTLTVETTAESVAGHETRIEFDPDVMTVEGVSPGDLGQAFASNRDNENGVVRVAQAQTGETDAPRLFNLTVTFEGDEGESASLAFDREYMSVFDAETSDIDVAFRDATIQSGTLGDVNDDGKVGAKDATLIQQYIAGQDPGGEDTVFRPAFADVDRSGSVTISDAIAVLESRVGDEDRNDEQGEESLDSPAAPA